MTTIDLTYLLVIGIPLLIILCVIMFMIGRQSGKKYVYHMMNGGQVHDYPSPVVGSAINGGVKFDKKTWAAINHYDTLSPVEIARILRERHGEPKNDQYPSPYGDM
ncbi:hypothetical protein EPVG_00196 [Emiliania huxleyi virus 201]|nr:hypothetical protein ELVG_00106 [Emiliania huxleyi virus 203]AET98083.1 hypothetical protein EPVG_00196 [Emiliania huxleyi virus 201]